MQFIKGHHFNFYYGYITSCGLHLDFYIPEIRLGIEFDGGQHYHPVKIFGGKQGFIKRCVNDRRKDWYCHKHHIHLIRIPYWDYDNINKILDKRLKPYLAR